LLLLNNIIGADKFREERVASGLIDDGLLEKLIIVVTHNRTSLSHDLLKAVYDLLCNITLSQQLSLRVSRSNILEPLLDLPVSLKTSSIETRKLLRLVLGVLGMTA